MKELSEASINDMWKRSGFHMHRFLGLVNEFINEEFSSIVATLEQENRQLRARNERLEEEVNASRRSSGSC